MFKNNGSALETNPEGSAFENSPKGSAFETTSEGSAFETESDRSVLDIPGVFTLEDDTKKIYLLRDEEKLKDQGAMGYVSSAIWMEGRSEKKVLLKRLYKPVNPNQEKLFSNEGFMSKDYGGGGIVKLYGKGETEEFLFMIMEFYDGQTLDKLIDQGMYQGKIQASYKLVRDVLSALRELHGAEVVHRDLKPANIIIRKNGKPVILDLGLACQPGLSDVAGLKKIGTPKYAAPEQLQGQFSCASDIYSLGKIFLEMLTGKVDDTQVNSIPQPYADFVKKCLNVKAENRYANAEEALEALSLMRSTSTQTDDLDRLDFVEKSHNTSKKKFKKFLPLVLGFAAVLFFVAVVVAVVVLRTSDKIVGLDYECNYSHNSSFISNIAAVLGNRAAEFNKGVCLMEKKEYGEAYDAFVSAAEKGLAGAQCELGYMYAEGLGFTQDLEKAEHWYRMAANQGDGSALASLGFMHYDGTVVSKDRSKAAKLWERALNIHPVPRGWKTWHTDVESHLGVMYLDGDGVEQNYDNALRYLTQAAEAGNAVAQNNLAYMYAQGVGVEQDRKKAIAWGVKSAMQGNAPAQLSMGGAYERGEGVEQDYNKAFEWYKKAAMQGDATAQNQLGIAYELGQGVEQDYNKAIEWYQKAAAQGLQVAQENLDRFYETPSADSEVESRDEELVDSSDGENQ